MKIPERSDSVDSAATTLRYQRDATRDSFTNTLKSMESEAARANDGHATRLFNQAVTWSRVSDVVGPTTADSTVAPIAAVLRLASGNDTGGSDLKPPARSQLSHISETQLEAMPASAVAETPVSMGVKPDLTPHDDASPVASEGLTLKRGRPDDDALNDARQQASTSPHMKVRYETQALSSTTVATVTACLSVDGIRVIARVDALEPGAPERLARNLKREYAADGVRIIDATINGRLVPVSDI